MTSGAGASLAILVLLAVGACDARPAPAAPTSAPPARQAQPATVFDLVDALRASPPRDRATVERLTGVRLDQRPGRYWTYYNSPQPIPLDRSTVTVDLRIPGEGATGDEIAFLVLDVRGDCIPGRAVTDRYAGLELKYDSSAHAVDPSSGFARDESWGELAFSMKDGGERCLTGAVFRVRN